MIEAKNLTKIFKAPTEEKSIFGAKKIDSAAVDDLSFSLKKGEVLSLLGPNGCGKTTTIGMILGLLKPTNGKVLINGIEIEKQRVELLNELNFISPYICLLYTSPSPRDRFLSRMPSSA